MHSETDKLYKIHCVRVYTDAYKERNPRSSNDWESWYYRWGPNLDEVQARTEKYYRELPGKYKSFDEMYTDKLRYVQEFTEQELKDARTQLIDRNVNQCCHLAVLRPCVCSYSTTCPIHGEQCYGTHD